MSSNSKIEWTDATWNVVAGCTKCSPGCLNCYAERMALRLAWMECKSLKRKPKYINVVTADVHTRGWTGQIFCDKPALDQPLHWRKPKRIFVCSMSDLFHEKVPFEFILKIFGISMVTPWHTYLILTKRIARVLLFFEWWRNKQRERRCLYGKEASALEAVKNLPADYEKANQYWLDNFDQSDRGKLDYPIPYPQPNIHLGVSISNQAEADEKIPILLQIPAAVRWLSIEPMLETIDINKWIWGNKCPDPQCGDSTWDHYCQLGEQLLHWVVVGCESGPKCRPCKLAWIESVIVQCIEANVPVFVKQINQGGKVIKMPKEYPQELPERK